MLRRSFVMIKPDGVQRELIGEIINRFEKKGVKLVGMKLMMIPKKIAKIHYEMHKDKSFFDGLIEFVCSGPVVAMVMDGENIINIIRKMVGATKPNDAQPGTIRGDYVLDTGYNIIHASDSPENAVREIKLFFKGEELIDYDLAANDWICPVEE